jgi:hypothetical protein
MAASLGRGLRRSSTKGMIDRWLQGYELAQRLRDRQERVRVRVIVQLERK